MHFVKISTVYFWQCYRIIVSVFKETVLNKRWTLLTWNKWNFLQLRSIRGGQYRSRRLQPKIKVK
jgi:hypothetical protein